MISSSFHSSTLVLITDIVWSIRRCSICTGGTVCTPRWGCTRGSAAGSCWSENITLQILYRYTVRIASYLLAQIRHRVLQIHQLIFLLGILNQLLVLQDNVQFTSYSLILSEVQISILISLDTWNSKLEITCLSSAILWAFSTSLILSLTVWSASALSRSVSFRSHSSIWS